MLRIRMWCDLISIGMMLQQCWHGILAFSAFRLLLTVLALTETCATSRANNSISHNGLLRIYVYNLPPHIQLWENRDSHGDQHWIEDYVRASKYNTRFGEKAHYFWIPPFQPLNLSHILEVFNWVKTAHPYWHASHNRHIFITTYDIGPGDLFPRPITLHDPAIPHDVNPCSPNRNVLFLNLNGLRDGSDNNESKCIVCFQGGKDIMLPTGEHMCGPTCGYTREELLSKVIWNPNNTQIRGPRKHLMFFGGVIADPTRDDYTGRGGAYVRYNSNPHFHMINTAEPNASRVDFSKAMQESEFCYSPRGSNGGDTDRYMAGLMFGCIPVFLSHSAAGQQMALPLDEVIPWSLFSTSIAWKDLDNLESHLRSLLPQVEQMRINMRPYVHQLLYTLKYGQYFGESLHDDVMHTLMRVLRQRITKTSKGRFHQTHFNA